MAGPSVTPEQLESLVVAEQYHVFPGTTVTVCCLTLKNGYNTVAESACASPDNFDPEKGRKYARQKAISKIWELEGYLLRQRLSDEG